MYVESLPVKHASKYGRQTSARKCASNAAIYAGKNARHAQSTQERPKRKKRQKQCMIVLNQPGWRRRRSVAGMTTRLRDVTEVGVTNNVSLMRRQTSEKRWRWSAAARKPSRNIRRSNINMRAQVNTLLALFLCPIYIDCFVIIKTL